MGLCCPHVTLHREKTASFSNTSRERTVADGMLQQPSRRVGPRGPSAGTPPAGDSGLLDSIYQLITPFVETRFHYSSGCPGTVWTRLRLHRDPPASGSQELGIRCGLWHPFGGCCCFSEKGAHLAQAGLKLAI